MTFLAWSKIKPEVRVNLSFLADGCVSPHDSKQGLTHWPWELHKYGHHLTDFPISKHRRRPPPDVELATELPIWKSFRRRDWTPVFPIRDESLVLLGELGLDPLDPVASIHLRRGDYLSRSSRLVEVEEVLRAIQLIEGFLPQDVLIFSDSPVESRDQSLLREAPNNRRVQIVSGSDQHAVHGILRRSSVLVTSNSTLSFSAGLLSVVKDVVILSPTHFFGPRQAQVNMKFQSLSQWMVV